MDQVPFSACRIADHRGADARLITAVCDQARFSQLTLAPYAERLIAAGETGDLVLVDQASEAIIARRRLGRTHAPDPP